MNIISGQAVDLLTPFPLSETARIFGWKHCYRTLPDDDDTPKTREEFIAQMEALLPQTISGGIIDKGQLTSQKHEAPMVGIVFFAPSGKRDGVIHFAAGRKAFKMGLVEEALALAVPGVFSLNPDLLRVSAILDESNTPAKGVLRRLGFRFEGVARDVVSQDGAPRSRVSFGLTRADVIGMQEANSPVPPVEEINTDGV